MLQGMTDKKAEGLVPLAKSWLDAPKMKITSTSYSGGSYDRSERAYLVEKTSPADCGPLQFVLEASKESPLLNPAIIVNNWGRASATLSVDGETIREGEIYRQGVRRGPLGEDLIVWIRLDKQQPVKITLEPVESR